MVPDFQKRFGRAKHFQHIFAGAKTILNIFLLEHKYIENFLEKSVYHKKLAWEDSYGSVWATRWSDGKVGCGGYMWEEAWKASGVSGCPSE